MLTLELFIAWLISQGRETTNLLDVMAEFDRATELFNYCQNSQPYVISVPAINEMFAGRKISAIKIIRAETNLGLKEAKNIADAFQETDRYKIYMSDQALVALREKLTGKPHDYDF